MSEIISSRNFQSEVLSEDKMVLVDFFSETCPPCRMMERHVFSRKEVGQCMSERFVAAKYDTDEATGKELMRKYGSGAIPLYLIFNTQGELLGRIQGASSADEFMDNVRKVLKR